VTGMKCPTQIVWSPFGENPHDRDQIQLALSLCARYCRSP
jgi:hypothetical protein